MECTSWPRRLSVLTAVRAHTDTREHRTAPQAGESEWAPPTFERSSASAVRAFVTVPATEMDCSVEVCHMRQPVVQAPVTSRRAVDERAAEIRHEAQSALLGIAAAA